MKKNLKLVFCVIAGLAMSHVHAEAVPSWLVPAGLRFISNPDDFFFNLHLDNVDYSPSGELGRGALRFNLLATTLPMTWANLNVKARVLGERSLVQWGPQVDIIGSYGRIAALDFVPAMMSDDDDFSSPSMKDYSIGLTLSKAVTRDTRLFAGFHHSVFALDFEFPDPIEIIPGDSLEAIKISRKDNILLTGITNRFESGKSLTAYMGYGFNYNKIFSRIVWHHKLFEMGFNIYPEGLLVIHPFLGMHWGL